MGASGSRDAGVAGGASLPVLALVAALPTSLGFVRKAWAFGFGYALSVGLGGTVLALCAPQPLPSATALQLLGAATHGLRLAGYLFVREKHARMPADYVARIAEMEAGDASRLGRLKRLPLVASCAGMYTLIMSPLAFAARHPPAEEAAMALPWAGVALQWAGLVTAAVADWQKHVHKRHSPDTWCDTGLYSYSRHPNYAGELLFWSGVYLAGVRSYRNAAEWATASLGLAAIVATMLGATRRLEAKEAARYAGHEQRTRYVAATEALAPRIKGVRLPRRIRKWRHGGEA